MSQTSTHDNPAVEVNEPYKQAPPNDDAAAQDQQNDEDVSFFDARNFGPSMVQAVGGTLNGYSIGFVGVYATLYGFSTNCAEYEGEKGCTTVPNADCKWIANSYCGWPDVTCRKQYPVVGGNIDSARDACLGDDRCTWSYGDDECQNPSGYSASDSGIFAGSMIVGCMIGSFFAGPLVSKIGAKRSFLLVGIAGVISSVMYHISAATDEFWVLVAGRFLIGVFLGVISVACPMYVDQNAVPQHKRIVGVLFQVFTTFGIFLAATIGLALGQSVWFDKDKDQRIMARQQGICVFSTALSLFMVCLGLFVAETRARFNGDGANEEGNIALDSNEFSYVQMLPRLGMGAVMAGTLQLTGINAVMNYAPTIMGNLGLAPLVGNFIVMTWNFVTTFVSIPLASWLTMRQLFLAGSIFTSCMCLFMCGIPVYPDVSSENVKNGVAITGILLFIMGFEFAVGPCYYVLTMDLFPPSFRPKGASVVQVTQFIFNIIINVCYPIATENISGGASGNQDKGQSIAFIFFGCIGIVCFVVQVFFLHPYDGADIGSLPEAPVEDGGDHPAGQSAGRAAPVDSAKLPKKDAHDLEATEDRARPRQS